MMIMFLLKRPMAVTYFYESKKAEVRLQKGRGGA